MANILIGPNDRLSLIDFGISRSMSADTITNLDLASGTPRYVAPEVLESGASSPSSDHYSSAVVLYEMLTGAWPFPDSGNNIATTLHHHLHSEPIAVSETNPWLPAQLDAPIQRALAKNSGDRFDSVGAFAAAVRAVPHEGATKGERFGGRRMKLVFAGLVFAGLCFTAFLMLRSTLGSEDPPAQALLPIESWEAGFAGSLECNLLAETDFDDGELVPGYFDAEVQNNAISSIGGVDQTSALQIGTTSQYGLYGERVEIEAGIAYLLSANVSRSGDPGTMIMRIGWLDEAFTPLDPEAAFVLADDANGQITVRSNPAPLDAVYAVAILENSASEGVFIADELVFARADAPCADRLLG